MEKEKIKKTDQNGKDQKNDKTEEDNIKKEEEKETSPEEKIKDLEDKLTRTFAEMENQRRRFEKEKEDAFEFGGFVLAKESLGLIDNLDRAKTSILNDETF